MFSNEWSQVVMAFNAIYVLLMVMFHLVPVYLNKCNLKRSKYLFSACQLLFFFQNTLFDEKINIHTIVNSICL